MPSDVVLYRQIKREHDKRMLKVANGLSEVIRELSNHIELVERKKDGACYFRIKGSKGKEKSFTSKSFMEWWKQYFEVITQ